MKNSVKQYFEALFSTPNFDQIKKSLNEGVVVKGLAGAERSCVLAGLDEQFIYVANDLIEANLVKKILLDFDVSCDIVYSHITSPVLTINNIDDQQIDLVNKIYDFLNGEIKGLIVLPSLLLQRLPSRQTLLENQMTIKSSSKLNQKDFEKQLVAFGFNKKDIIYGIGDFCVRGDIVEVSSRVDDNVVRIEFFDDEIEKIKICDRTSMAVLSAVEEYYFHPISVYFVKQSQKDQVLSQIVDLKNKNSTNPKLDENLSRVENLVENSSCVPSFAQPFLQGYDNSLFDVFDDTIFAFNETKKIKDEMIQTQTEYVLGLVNLVEGGELVAGHKDFFLDPNCVLERVKRIIRFDSFDIDTTIRQIDFNKIQTNKYTFDYSKLLIDLNEYRKQNFKVVLFAGGKTEKKNIIKFMLDNDMYFDDFTQKKNCGIYISSNYFSSSLGFGDEKFVAIGTGDLIKKSLDLSVKNKKKVFYLPKVGDYVVHVTHGIGKCVSVEKLKLSSVYKDYFVIEYKGGDRLYVPSEQANSISAYLGGESDPKLNKIGGLEFRKAKEKVYKSVQEMAGELIKLYSEREKKPGFEFSPDSYLQEAFEDAFVYDETDDQLIASSEIKKDMESSKIMDRLLCGDVGFGKTEVAMRAAFKAVQDGKQVAFVCPTTILSQQHFNTMKKRYSDFMCEVEVLNRFKTSKEQKNILEKLKLGKIDIICGTHRLLSKDVEFKDLGLLILDEEQRFGVADKEKIKKIKSDIDVLTLSATPIPRTLHMSLSGIRDISVLSTPPKDRLPIQTYVTEFSGALLKDACLKEMARGGQVLVVFNRVEQMNQFVAFVKDLLPNINVGFAHGQMEEHLLEQTINKLYNKEYQVFISTTLIENGIDLPLANTLFVLDSDRLGLSQLYQLRGRIGRGNRLAYAYFTYDGSKKLTDQAYKRLEAITQFRELGSGFKIAMRDLEIRGAGNVLGREQHGQMQKVGYDLYCKILEQAVSDFSGKSQKPLREVKLDIAVEAYINPNYIGREDLRIKIYNSISELSSVSGMREFQKDIENSFGKLDLPAQNLLKLAVVKNLAQQHNISRILLNNSNFSLFFYENEKIIEQNVVDAVSFYNKFCVLKFSPLPIIEVKLDGTSTDSKLEFLLTMLTKMST